YYNYYRDYDAVTGRYVQADPIGLAGGMNPYLYANGSPLRYSDPTGQIPPQAITAAIGAAAGALGDTGAQVYGMYRSGWCKKFNWRELGISTLAGAVSGGALPIASKYGGVAGVVLVGGVTNLAVFGANGGSVRDTKGVAWAVGTGVLGGTIGGKFARRTRYGMGGTAASVGMVMRSNNAADVRLNVRPTPLTRAVGGGVASGAPAPFGAPSDGCECDPRQ
ncbi:MAG: RHS repeat-associated core domain-containing protein, partial [Luteibacter sp.]